MSNEWTEGPFTIRQRGARFLVYHDGQLRLGVLGEELAALCDVVTQAETARQEQVVGDGRRMTDDRGQHHD